MRLAFLVLIAFLIGAPAGAHEALKGSLEVVDPGHSEVALTKAIPQVDRRSREYVRTGPPQWIPGPVYTNDMMIMRVAKRVILPFMSRTIKSEIPRYTESPMTIKKTVLAHWKGKQPSTPCRVTCAPFGPEGNFRFFHADPGGPRGYLERLGRDSDGFMTYRYWFEEPVRLSRK